MKKKESDLFMIIGPAASFFIQIGKIKQMNSSEGFSKLIILNSRKNKKL